MKQRTIYSLMMTGGVIGLVSAFLQTLQKITSLQNKDKILRGKAANWVQILPGLKTQQAMYWPYYKTSL